LVVVGAFRKVEKFRGHSLVDVPVINHIDEIQRDGDGICYNKKNINDFAINSVVFVFQRDAVKNQKWQVCNNQRPNVEAHSNEKEPELTGSAEVREI